MEKLKKFLIKKQKGAIDSYTVPVVTLVALTVIIAVIITAMRSFGVKDETDIIAREYLLKMESEGYLIPSDKLELENRLKKIGAKNISIDNSCENKIKYGETVTLKFKCDLPVEKINFTWNEKTKSNIEYVTKEYSISTTSKGD